MEMIYVKEVNKEVWIDLGRNFATRLAALKEAAHVLQREVMREESKGLRHGGGNETGGFGDF